MAKKPSPPSTISPDRKPAKSAFFKNNCRVLKNYMEVIILAGNEGNMSLLKSIIRVKLIALVV